MTRVLLALCVVFFCPHVSAAPAKPSPPVVTRAETVALVLSDVRGGVAAYCAGVWVGPTVLLTAKHCVKSELLVGYVTAEDVFPAGAKAPYLQANARGAFEILSDDAHDLTLLRAFSSPAGHAVARVRTEPIEAGLRVHTMGHPLGLWFSYSSGDVAAVRTADLGEQDEGALWVQSTAPISAGNSGGGLFDSSGCLVGLAHALMPQGQQLNFYVHAQYIQALLDKARQLSLL